MKTGLILTVGSFGFMVLLIMSYHLQERTSNLGSKIYRIMVSVVIALLITEIIAGYYFVFIGKQSVYMVLLRIHWYTGIAWYWCLYLYSLCFLKDIKATTIRELIKTDGRAKVLTIFTIVYSIIYFFLPFKKMTYETFNFIPGIAAWYVLAYCAFVIFLITILTIKRRREISNQSANATAIMIVDIAIIFTLQIIFPRTAILGLGATLQMYFLYFYIENPDLLMIKSLEESKKEIDRSNLAKTDFLSNMSHEIRSPMNAIIGFSETILNNPEFDEKSIREDVEHIDTAGNNLLDIINNILDVSKIESGNETLEEKEYSVGNVVMELSSIIDARLDNRPIKFIPEVDTKIPKTVYGDSTKLFQVLLNILTNSIKYTEVGKIKLTVTQDVKMNNVTLKFKISDTGYGIKKEDYDKLFEKFERLNSATSNEIEGTGLGLVITKRYVDLLGGKIWFESDYGVGTTFYVEITQRIVDPTPLGNIREARVDEQDIKYIDCSDKKILIVDDNELNLKVSKKILSKYKFTIDTIKTGKECVYRIKEGQRYDMIFLDHMMPEMDGIEVVHILRKLEDYNIPPIVALTANAITGARDMYLREGFDEYLSKPINMSELNRIINKYFKKEEAPEEIEEMEEEPEREEVHRELNFGIMDD